VAFVARFIAFLRPRAGLRARARANEMARNKSSGFEPDAYLAKLFTAGLAVSDLKDWLLRLDSRTSNPPVNGRKKKR